MSKHKAMPAMTGYDMETDEEMIEHRSERDYGRQSKRVDRKIVARNAAGVDEEYVDFAEFDDGQGNKIMHGDLSVQHMVEDGDEGRRTGYPKPFMVMGKKG